jgi:hypothetical protein
MNKELLFKIALGIFATVFVLVVIFIFMFGLRWFNSATIQTKIVIPKPGIECVVASTTDGAAIDCWKIDDCIHELNGTNINE